MMDFNRSTLMKLRSEGYAIMRNFISFSTTQRLTSEYSNLFSDSNSLRDRGYSLIKYDLNNDCRVLKFPELWIESVNLLDLSVQIGDILREEYYQPNGLQFKCTGIECREDIGDKLSVHSDKSFYRLRAYIFLTEATDGTSGELQYVPNTNHIDWAGANQSNISTHTTLVTCSVSPGDLVIIDINGLHASTVRKRKRKVIIFDYDEYSSSEPCTTTLIIPASKLSPLVQRNLDLFSTQNIGLRPGSMSQIYHAKPLNIFPDISIVLHLTFKMIAGFIVKFLRFFAK